MDNESLKAQAIRLAELLGKGNDISDGDGQEAIGIAAGFLGSIAISLNRMADALEAKA